MRARCGNSVVRFGGKLQLIALCADDPLAVAIDRTLWKWSKLRKRLSFTWCLPIGTGGPLRSNGPTVPWNEWTLSAVSADGTDWAD